MIIGKITNQNIGKIKIDTFPGKKMRISPIEKANHSDPRIFESPHLLAPAYKKGCQIKMLFYKERPLSN